MILGGLGMIFLSERRHLAAQAVWAGFVVFCALIYLTEDFWKSAVIAIFVFVSCLLGFGQRWLMPGAFAVVIVAIAVWLGAPAPDQWGHLFDDARRMLAGERW
jgi:hypothetical protein